MNTSQPSQENVLDYYTAQTVFVLTAAYILNLILGFPVYVYVLWLIATRVAGSVAAEFFSINLIVSETIFCLSGILVFLDFYLFDGSLFLGRMFFIEFICVARPLFQCCICAERYLAVVHPVLFMKFKLLWYRVALSGLIWFLVIGCCVSGLLLSFPDIMFYFYMAEYISVFSVKACLCLAVLRILKRPGPGDGDREREGTNNTKQKAFYIILVSVVAHLITILAVIVTVPLQSKLPIKEYYFAVAICFFFLILTGFAHPCLYLWKRRTLPCIKRS